MVDASSRQRPPSTREQSGARYLVPGGQIGPEPDQKAKLEVPSSFFRTPVSVPCSPGEKGSMEGRKAQPVSPVSLKTSRKYLIQPICVNTKHGSNGCLIIGVLILVLILELPTEAQSRDISHWRSAQSQQLLFCYMFFPKKMRTVPPPPNNP